MCFSSEGQRLRFIWERLTEETHVKVTVGENVWKFVVDRFLGFFGARRNTSIEILVKHQ